MLPDNVFQEEVAVLRAVEFSISKTQRREVRFRCVGGRQRQLEAQWGKSDVWP